MICPNFGETIDGEYTLDDFTLEGDTESMITQNFILNFDRCNTSSRTDCKSDAEIDQYIKDVRIDVNAAFQIVNYEKFGSKPVTTTQDIFYSLNLGSNPGYVLRPFVYLTKNEIET